MNDRLADAYVKALEGDPIVLARRVAVNREVDVETAGQIAGNAYEALVAPSYSEAARRVLSQKEKLTRLSVPSAPSNTHGRPD